MRIDFVLVCEGPSDEGLIPHLESLCIEAGADEVTGVAPDFRRLPDAVGHTVEEKLRAALVLAPNANLLFVHRDADARRPDGRYAEVQAAVEACADRRAVVALVPLQETEAWLLLDEDAIRAVAGRPSERTSLRLPKPDAVERTARPKERLRAALERAAGVSGRRLERFRADFPVHRRTLLEQLPTGGPLERLPSWVRLRNELAAVLATM